MKELEFQSECLKLLKSFKAMHYLDYRRTAVQPLRGGRSGGYKKNPMKGWPDITVFFPNDVAFFELKIKGGVLSKEQDEFREMCLGLNISHHVVETYRQFQDFLYSHLPGVS